MPPALGFLMRTIARASKADLVYEYAFGIGRPASSTGVEGIGRAVGVGMKRAIFKLGARSQSSRATRRRVATKMSTSWAADDDPDWSFHFEELEGLCTPPRT